MPCITYVLSVKGRSREFGSSHVARGISLDINVFKAVMTWFKLQLVFFTLVTILAVQTSRCCSDRQGRYKSDKYFLKYGVKPTFLKLAIVASVSNINYLFRS